MITMTIRSLWARKLRFALTGLAVVLGVAFIAGTFVLTDTVQSSFDHILDTANSGVDVVVQDADASGGGGYTGERVDESLVDTIRNVDGVAAVAGTIDGFAQLVGSDGEVPPPGGVGGTIGMNWIDDPELTPLAIVTGRPPTAADEVALDVGTLDREGWTLGDTVTVLGRGEPTQLTVVGTVRYGDIESLPGTSLVVTADETAQQLFAAPGMYDSIVARAADGVSATELTAGVRHAITEDSIDVKTGMQDTEERKATLHDELAFFNTFLLVFAFIALFVGTFIIRNTFSIVVAQRQKESAMLRAIGASRRQLVRSTLFEASLVGVIASAVGLVAGFGVAYALKELFAAIGLELPPSAMVVQGRTIVVSAIVGIGVTVLSGIGPALRGSRIKPVAAMRGVALDSSGSSRTRTIAGLAVFGAGSVLFAMGMTSDGSGSAAPIGLGAVLAFVGVGILGPVIVRPAMRLLGVGYRPVFGTVGQMAKENAQRNPKRTAATSSALMVGVALVTLITVLAASAKASTAARVERVLQADFIVESGGWEQGGFSPELAQQLGATHGVTAVSPLRSTTAQIGGSTVGIQGVDTEMVSQVLDLDVQAGSLADVHGDAIAVEATTADNHGWTLGETITVDFVNTGEQQLTVAAILGEMIPYVEGGTYVVGLDTFAANVTDQFDIRVYVTFADGTTTAEGRAALAPVLAQWPNAELQDQAEARAAVAADIDKVLNFVYGLLALAVIIALIGIANTLGLSIHERRREVGVLRAIGMERAQVRRSVRLESILVALLGTVLGAAVALFAAWGMVHAMSSSGLTAFAIPVAPMVVIAVAAVIAGVLAAVGPARRAARQDVLAAIAAN